MWKSLWQILCFINDYIQSQVTHVEKWQWPWGPVTARLLTLNRATTSVQNVVQSAVTEASFHFHSSLLKQTETNAYITDFFPLHITFSGCKISIKTWMGRRWSQEELHAFIWLWVCRCEMTNLRMLLEGGERARRDKDEVDYFNVCACDFIYRLCRLKDIFSLKNDLSSDISCLKDI